MFNKQEDDFLEKMQTAIDENISLYKRDLSILFEDKDFLNLLKGETSLPFYYILSEQIIEEILLKSICDLKEYNNISNVYAVQINNARNYLFSNTKNYVYAQGLFKKNIEPLIKSDNFISIKSNEFNRLMQKNMPVYSYEINTKTLNNFGKILKKYNLSNISSKIFSIAKSEYLMTLHKKLKSKTPSLIVEEMGNYKELLKNLGKNGVNKDYLFDNKWSNRLIIDLRLASLYTKLSFKEGIELYEFVNETISSGIFLSKFVNIKNKDFIEDVLSILKNDNDKFISYLKTLNVTEKDIDSYSKRFKKIILNEFFNEIKKFKSDIEYINIINESKKFIGLKVDNLKDNLSSPLKLISEEDVKKDFVKIIITADKVFNPTFKAFFSSDFNFEDERFIFKLEKLNDKNRSATFNLKDLEAEKSISPKEKEFIENQLLLIVEDIVEWFSDGEKASIAYDYLKVNSYKEEYILEKIETLYRSLNLSQKFKNQNLTNLKKVKI